LLSQAHESEVCVGGSENDSVAQGDGLGHKIAFQMSQRRVNSSSWCAMVDDLRYKYTRRVEASTVI